MMHYALKVIAIVLLAGSTCWSQANDLKPEKRLKDPPVNEETKPYVDCLKEMIGVLKKIGNEEGPMQQPAKDTAAALESALKDGRGYLEGLPPGTGAAVLQGGNNEKTKTLILDPKVRALGTKCDPCEPDFLLFLGTLVHEAVHLGQDPNTEKPKTLDEKLKKLENECPAYDKAQSWRRNLRNAVEALQDKRRGKEGAKPPAWLETLVNNCPEDERAGLLADLLRLGNLDLANDGIRLDQIGNFLSKCLRDKKKLAEACKTEDPVKQAECLDKDERVGHFFSPIPPDGPEAVFTWNARAGTFFIDDEPFEPGTPSVQDAFIFEDTTTRTWLLVAGNAGEAGAGTVRLHRLERQGGTVQAVESKTVSDPDGFLEFLTGVARRADGRFFAFDFKKATIHELQDSNGDGVPDVVGASAATLPPPEDTRHFTHLTSVDNHLVLQVRMNDPLYGNNPRLVLTDAAGDGFYEAFQQISPSEFPSVAPCWTGALVQGMTEVGVAGVHGHPFVIVSLQNPNQPLAQGQFPAFPNREIFVQLARPLQAGEEVEVRDQFNNQSTPSGLVLPRQLVLHQTLPIRVKPKQEVEVSLRGAGFEHVAKVRIGGKPAQILTSATHTLQIRTASLKRAERYQITFEMEDGSEKLAELSLFPDLSDE